MHKDKVLEIARECGIRVHTTGSPMVAINCYTALESEMLKFADAIEAATREECAKLCDGAANTSEATANELFEQADLPGQLVAKGAAKQAEKLAEAIRNMGKEG